jgi:alpha-glucosidase
VFVRPGAIIPRQPLVMNTAEMPQGALELHVYPGADCSGTLYADDGTTLAHTRGAYLRRAVRCATDSEGITVTLDAAQGRFKPWWREIAIVVHDWAAGDASVRRGGTTLPAVTDARARTATVRLAYRATATTVRFSRR